jgi:hypothetical protein
LIDRRISYWEKKENLKCAEQVTLFGPGNKAGILELDMV